MVEREEIIKKMKSIKFPKDSSIDEKIKFLIENWFVSVVLSRRYLAPSFIDPQGNIISLEDPFFQVINDTGFYVYYKDGGIVIKYYENRKLKKEIYEKCNFID